jgi:peptide/nickel transport system substrate-binding protein
MINKRFAGAIYATVAVLALSACSGAASTDSAPAPAEGQTAPLLTLGTVVDVPSYDPADLRYGGEFPQLWAPVYDTLLKLDPDGGVSENLATEWSYNDDNTVLTMTLRDDVTFTDGDTFDAAAVKANLEHFIAGTGTDRYLADSIATVDVLDEFEVAISLTEPDPVLEYYLAQSLGAIGAPDALESETIKLEPVGSGPYVLDTTQTVRGDQYVFTRNADYWNAEDFPYDELVVKVFSDVNARLNALTSGQIQGARLNVSLMDQATASGLELYPNRVDWIGLNIMDRDGVLVPALADVRVRQAINSVFDREGMLEGIDLGQGTVTEQIVGEASSAYDADLNETYEFDVDAAKDLMEEAGYAAGFSVPMMDYSRYKTYQPYVEQALGSIGITVEWIPVTDATAVEESISGNFPILIMSQAAPAQSWDALNVAYQSSYNAFDTQDPEFTALMETAQASSGDEQEQAYKDANAWLVDNAWFAPWYYLDLIYATSDDVAIEVQAGSAGPQLRYYAPAE